jgi:hypothetical protein
MLGPINAVRITRLNIMTGNKTFQRTSVQLLMRCSDVGNSLESSTKLLCVGYLRNR